MLQPDRPRRRRYLSRQSGFQSGRRNATRLNPTIRGGQGDHSAEGRDELGAMDLIEEGRKGPNEGQVVDGKAEDQAADPGPRVRLGRAAPTVRVAVAGARSPWPSSRIGR